MSLQSPTIIAVRMKKLMLMTFKFFMIATQHVSKAYAVYTATTLV